MSQLFTLFRREKAIILGVLAVIFIYTIGQHWLADLADPLKDSIVFIGLFAVMMMLAFNVVHHAESLAEILGEPYGTLILTLSVVGIEVIIIAAVMLTGDNVPTLARDTMFSVLMIVLNGMFGLTLLVGGLRYAEQSYNLQGANIYLGVLAPLAVLGLVLPNFTPSTPGGQVSPMMAIFLLIISVSLYSVFLALQTMIHTKHFKMPVDEEKNDDEKNKEHRGVGYHTLFLLLSMIPMILLAKSVAVIIDYGISIFHAPRALGGFLVAILVLSPEAMSATKSALANKLQRTVNITLGSGLSTIGLTIPAVLGISLITGRTITLGLGAQDITILVLTLFVSAINFATGRTNVLQGCVHLILFLAYIMLIFD